MEDYQDRLISEFNEAYYQISRLHNIWLNCKSRRERGDLNSYRWVLDTAKLELWNDAVRLDGENSKYNFVEQLDKIEKEIDKVFAEKKFLEFYKKLMEKEKILRLIQETAGKGAKFRSSDDDGI